MKQYDSREVARALLYKLGRQQMKAAVLAVPFITGCGAIYTPNPMHEGHIALIADAKGMRAFSDMTTGLVNETKTPGDMKSSYYQHRDLREVEETKRATAPGFLSGLFAKPSRAGGEQ